MILTKQQLVSLPNTISIDSVNIEVVSCFKLLGVMIDRKLDFHNHVDVIKTLVNRKLFSYKKLFYLSFTTKVQFFKTFILPHFDYCFSLYIYFTKT
jgi:hypothetical protein